MSIAEGLAMRVVRVLARLRIRWVELGAGWFNAAPFKADFVSLGESLHLEGGQSRAAVAMGRRTGTQ